MQSRNEDFRNQSSIIRTSKHTDAGPGSYQMMPPHLKRSLSPLRREGPSNSHRMFGGHRRSSSLERRRVVDDGSRRTRSRSPLFMEVRRGKNVYDDDHIIDKDFPPSELHRKYEFLDYIDMNRRDVGSRMRDELGYSMSEAMMEEKFQGSRTRGVVGHKSAVAGEGDGGRVYQSPADVRPTSKYEEQGRNFSVASVPLGLDQLRNDRIRYPEVYNSFPADKYADMEQYHQEAGKSVLHPRDRVAPYSNVTASRSKESMGVSNFKDYAIIPPGNSRVDYFGQQGGAPLPPDDHPRSSVKVPEPLSHSRYGQRQALRHGRDTDLHINDDTARFLRETFSPPRIGQHDSFRHQPRIRENDDYVYPSEEIYGKMKLHEPVDYRHRDLISTTMMDPVAKHSENIEFSRGNVNNSSLWDHHSADASNRVGLSRPTADIREGRQYSEATVHSRLGRKISSEHEMPYLEMVRDHETRMRVDYDCKRDVGPGSHKERMRRPPESIYGTEGLRLAEKAHRMEGDDFVPYDPSRRMMKRKYMMDEEEIRVSSRTNMSRLDSPSARHDRYDRGEEWIDRGTRFPSFHKRGGHTHELSRRACKNHDDKDPTSVDWFSSHDTEELVHDHPARSYQYGSKYEKSYSRSGAPDWYDSYHPSRRHVHPKWKNVWLRGEDDEVDMHSDEVEQYENWDTSGKSEQHEDSEEFKLLVHDLFLSFTKKLNETPGVRRRYVEQGRAGSLFCIVCGRSLSKEFLDTQRLATHAFMSHKIGLRAQHLALHKAICVLLGWNSTVPPETITWYPEHLSVSESLAQKEDLIIWPPVIVIHNTSVLNNDSDDQESTYVEALGQFLRGKGFSGGKIKLGKPPNGSIMLVKFLGTFSGLQDAEKIHQYFAKNKHGRKEFEQIASGKGKNSSNAAEGGEKPKGDKVNEFVLFGYMGIAEDLDKVDFDTKRKCSVKSKKDIQDLVDAPLKSK